jgi:hypothetical protein
MPIHQVAIRRDVILDRLIDVRHFEAVEKSKDCMSLVEIVVYWHHILALYKRKSCFCELTNIHEVPILHDPINQMSTRTSH